MYFTEEERKEKYVFHGKHFVFTTCKDLSSGVHVEPMGLTMSPDREAMNRDVMDFTMEWNRNCYGRLNGFSGLSCVNWTFDNFKHEIWHNIAEELPTESQFVVIKREDNKIFNFAIYYEKNNWHMWTGEKLPESMSKEIISWKYYKNL